MIENLWNKFQIPLRWLIHGILLKRAVLILFPNYIGSKLNKESEKEFTMLIKSGKKLNDCRKKKIIISLTTIPKRIDKVKLVVSRMMSQSILPDRIILYLDKSQEKNIVFSKEIKDLVTLGLEIKFVEDIGPHTKYYYSLQDYKDHIVITVDDDIIYSHNLIETLMKSYKKYPTKISANIVTNYKYNKNGELMPSIQWRQKLTYGVGNKESIAYGVGGVLYPPRIMPEETFDKEKIKNLSLFADDLWLKVIENKYNIDVVKANGSDKLFGYFVTVDGTQEVSLRSKNDFEDRNVRYLKKLLRCL